MTTLEIRKLGESFPELVMVSEQFFESNGLQYRPFKDMAALLRNLSGMPPRKNRAMKNRLEETVFDWLDIYLKKGRGLPDDYFAADAPKSPAKAEIEARIFYLQNEVKNGLHRQYLRDHPEKSPSLLAWTGYALVIFLTIVGICGTCG